MSINVFSTQEKGIEIIYWYALLISFLFEFKRNSIYPQTNFFFLTDFWHCFTLLSQKFLHCWTGSGMILVREKNN
jgi:hypothetical protein